MVNLPISPKCALIWVIALNALFIVAGIIKMGIGIHANVTDTKPEFKRFEPETDGVTNIVAGCLDIVIGACGLTGALLKSRKLLVANAALLASAVLGHIVMITVFGVAGSQQISTVTKGTNELIVRQYGNKSDTDSRDTTKVIDEIQIKDSCCGWSRSDDKNLFLQSPWYRENVPPRQLPDSCCITTGDECVQATDIANARKLGFVKDQDCLEMIVKGIKTFTWISIIQELIVMLMQIPLLAFAVLILLSGEMAAAASE